MAGRSRRRRGTPGVVVAVGLAGAVLYVALSWTASTTKSATFDEAVHLLSGYRILTEGDFAFNHEHPPLMKTLAAAPLAVTGSAVPLESWRYLRERDQWPLAHRWLYHANDGDRLLGQARLQVALVGALLGLAVFFTARAAAGGGAAGGEEGTLRGVLTSAGALALLLFAVEPNLLAHGSLVTTDLGMSAFYFAGAAAFWRYLATRRAGWLAAAGVLYGLDMAAKFTGVLLGPVMAVMGAAWILSRPPAPPEERRPAASKTREIRWGLARGGPWLHLILSLAFILAVALLVLGALYGFEGFLEPLRERHHESDRFQELAAGPLGAVPLPLPSQFVAGFDHAEAGGEVWPSYLMGEFSGTGRREYYLVALAVKTSLPLAILALLGLALGGRAGAGARTRWILLVLPPGLLLAVFTFSANLKNIGLRYVLAVYPFLCVLGGLGAVALLRGRWRWGPAFAALLCLGAVAGEAAIYPDHLAYFNVAAGGPDSGRWWLVDSNLDWGQDLKGLGRWMKDNDVPSIYLDYFGRACPRYEGIHTEEEFGGGWIAVSATNLVGVYRPGERDRYDFLMSREPEASIGHSILIWNAPRPEDWKPRPGTPSR